MCLSPDAESPTPPAGSWGGPSATTKVIAVEVATDQAPVYPSLLEELLPAAWHRTDC
jgi:hypothetical protein